MAESIEKLVKIESIDKLREMGTGREIYINIKGGNKKDTFIGGKFISATGKYLELTNYSKLPMSLGFEDYSKPEILNNFRRIKELSPSKQNPEMFELEFPISDYLDIYVVEIGEKK